LFTISAQPIEIDGLAAEYSGEVVIGGCAHDTLVALGIARHGNEPGARVDVGIGPVGWIVQFGIAEQGRGGAEHALVAHKGRRAGCGPARGAVVADAVDGDRELVSRFEGS
jgi:hypothetical protein